MNRISPYSKFLILFIAVIVCYFYIPKAEAEFSFLEITGRESKRLTLYSRISLTSKEIVDIPYSKKTWFVNDLPSGERKVTTPGRNGKKIITKSINFSGEYISSKVTKEEIVFSPLTEITSIGTTKKYYVLTLDDGSQIQYTRAMFVFATSYDHTCKGCNHITATGRWLTKGIIAVDPRVIKLGTRMYVPGYGFGEAQDTGGKIKENRIDLGFDDLVTGEWRAHWLTIYLLD